MMLWIWFLGSLVSAVLVGLNERYVEDDARAVAHTVRSLFYIFVWPIGIPLLIAFLITNVQRLKTREELERELEETKKKLAAARGYRDG